MKSVLDTFADIASWVGSAGVELSLSKFQYISLNGLAIRAKFPAESAGKYFGRTFATPVDCSEFKTLRFHTMQLNENREDSKLIVQLYLAGVLKDEWVISYQYNKKSVVDIALGAVTSFDEIRFLTESADQQCYFVDSIIVCNDEPIYDILDALREEIDRKVGILVGNLSVSAAAGETAIGVEKLGFLSEYSVISIVENGVEEFHQLKGDVSTGILAFTEDLDGPALVNSFTTDAVVYQVIPAVFSSRDKGIINPSIVISGFLPGISAINTPFQVLRDSYKRDGQHRKHTQGFDFDLDVQVEVRSSIPEIQVPANMYLQYTFGDGKMLNVNNIMQDIDYVTPPSFERSEAEQDVDYTLHEFKVHAIYPFMDDSRNVSNQKVGVTLTIENSV